MIVDQIEMSYLEALMRATLQDHRDIVLARKYHEGKQDVFLTERVKEFLGMHEGVGFRLNICRTIVSAVTDEMSVVGFDTSEEPDDDGIKSLAVWAWDIWTKNRMETIQDVVHESILRDRETFVIVDWDAEHKRPRFTHNQRFTTVEAGGDGFGCWIVYENDDPNQTALCAVKQWTETIILDGGGSRTRTRRTIYYPDRIERWAYDGGWNHFVEEGQDWPTPWMRGKGKNAKPRGIPVFHFRNKGLRPEAWDAIPIQDVINKTLVDLVGTLDLAGFPILVAFGFIPTTDGQALKTDGSNAMKIEPMRILGSTKNKNEADMKKLDATDPTQMMNALKDLVLLAAMITDTPTSRFTTTRQVANADTQKEQEKPLRKKAADRRDAAGDVWRQCMEMARILANDYGREDLDESIAFDVLWQFSENLDELIKKQAFGVPTEQLWLEMGYTQDKIAVMSQSPEYLAKVEKATWEAVAAASGYAPVSLILSRLGWEDDDVAKYEEAMSISQSDNPPTDPLTGDPMVQ